MLRLLYVLKTASITFIFFFVLVFLTSCRSIDVYIVPSIDYRSAPYSERMKYLARLYNANELNKKNTKHKRFIVME